jgi:hypothetical protein
MNPLDVILESPHRWSILAGLSLLIGAVGAIVMLTYAWPHGLAQAWFYIWFAAALYFGLRAFLDWKRVLDTPESADRRRPERSS